jgi:hypothetical protein
MEWEIHNKQLVIINGLFIDGTVKEFLQENTKAQPTMPYHYAICPSKVAKQIWKKQ